MGIVTVQRKALSIMLSCTAPWGKWMQPGWWPSAMLRTAMTGDNVVSTWWIQSLMLGGISCLENFDLVNVYLVWQSGNKVLGLYTYFWHASPQGNSIGLYCSMMVIGCTIKWSIGYKLSVWFGGNSTRCRLLAELNQCCAVWGKTLKLCSVLLLLVMMVTGGT